MITDELIQRANKKCEEAKFLINKYSQAENSNELAKALELYYESIKIYPLHSEPYIAIAYVCIISDMLDEAKRLLQKALEIEPFNLFAIKMLTGLKSKTTDKKIEPIKTNTIATINRVENVTAINNVNLQNMQKLIEKSKIKIMVNQQTRNTLSKLSRVSETKEIKFMYKEIPKNSEPLVSEINNYQLKEPDKIKIKVSENTLNRLNKASSNDFAPIISLFDDEDD